MLPQPSQPTPTPSKTGLTAQVAKASSDQRVRDLGPDGQQEIRKLLGQLFILTGLRKENFPDELQTALLIQFISEDLGNYSLEDFRIAFRLAVKGDLDAEVNHYQSFSGVYIAKIMSAYVKVRTHHLKSLKSNENALKIESKMEHTDQEKRDIRKDYILTCIINPFRYYLKTGGLTFGITPMSIIYNTLTLDLQVLVLEGKDKKAIYDQAVKEVKASLKTVAKSLEEHRQINATKKKIEDLGFEKAMEYEIKSACYEISVKGFYRHCKENNIDLESLILSQL